ncbi:MAG: glycosyltransferase family 39 protein [bacterium]|nr:glycosyltransferase family 39 protein [bacterium]
MISRGEAVTAAAVVVLAAGLRLWGLTAKSLWFDETISIFLASQPLERMLALVVANDPHPPLHYLLLHFWMAFFGSGEAAVRVLSVLISVPVVAVTWAFGRRLVGAGPALFAALLVAASPSQVAAGQEARMYGLLTLTALLSWWALWGAVVGGDRRGDADILGGRRAWATYAVATAAMLYSHYYGFFVVASQVGYLLWRRTAKAQWRRWVYASLGVMLLFIPWMPSFVQQLAGGRAWPAHRVPLAPATLFDTLAAMTVGRPILDPWGPKLTTIQAVGTSWIAVVGLIAAVALAVAAVRGSNTQRETRALLISAALGPPVVAFAVSLGINVYAPRYLLFIVPPVALLVGAGAAALAGGRARLLGAAGVLLPVLVLIPNAVGTAAFHRQSRLDVFDWRLVSRTLAEQARPEDAIAFLPGFSRIPVNYYFRGPQPRIVLTPRGEGDVEGPGGARLPQVADALARHQRVWILTVPPVPPAVGTLLEALRRRGFEVRRQEAVNMARLILVERLQER